MRPRAARPCPRTFSAVVSEPSHPAAGEHGLFAAVPMAHGTWVLDYVGAVCLGEHEDRSSDYVCDFGEHSELALDAKHTGNEARLLNDYRNTGRHANVEFRLRRDTRGELRQGIFVCAKHGVQAGEELLVSYGKSFWRSRVEEQHGGLHLPSTRRGSTSDMRAGARVCGRVHIWTMAAIDIVSNGHVPAALASTDHNIE